MCVYTYIYIRIPHSNEDWRKMHVDAPHHILCVCVGCVCDAYIYVAGLVNGVHALRLRICAWVWGV